MTPDLQSRGEARVDTVLWRLLAVFGCLVLGALQAWVGGGVLFVLSAHASFADWAGALVFLVTLPCAFLAYPFPRATAAILLATVLIGFLAVVVTGIEAVPVWALLQAPIQLVLAGLAWHGRSR